MKRWSSFLAVLCAIGCAAQMPDTDIWLFAVENDRAGTLRAVEPRNITAREGYDNQPAFSHDNRLVYYATDANGPTDIFAYDLRKKQTKQVTTTPVSEFSPRPYGDGSRLSVLRVEQDSAQRVHLFDVAPDPKKGRRLAARLPNDSIGYYAFLNTDTAVVYKLTEPHSLRWVTRADSTEHLLAEHPTRTFWPVNRHAVVFGTGDSTATTFYIYDFALMRAYPYAARSTAAADTWWHHELGLLVAGGKKIRRYDANAARWTILFDLSAHPISRIGRFVFSSDGKWLALVDHKAAH